MTAFAALLAAPLTAAAFPRLDRRILLSLLAMSAAASNVVVALASNLAFLLVGRVLLGFAIGGFWAMSLAVAAQLSAPQHRGRSLMLVNLGGTVATVAGVPAGIWLQSLADWRAPFLVVAGVTVVVAAATWLVLPVTPPSPMAGLRAFGGALKVPGALAGLVGHTLVMVGNFAAFT